MERRTVILVESSPGIQEMVQSVVDQLDGAGVFAAESVEQAEAMARELKPALIIADEDAPPRSGQLLISSLKADMETRDIPIVILCSDSQECRELVSEGAEAFLPKPFDVSDLIGLIQFYTQTVPPRPGSR